MSVIFGIREIGGKCIDEPRLRHLGSGTGRYAVDGTFIGVKNNIGMGFQPLYTHGRSTLEKQPLIDELGNMAVWDGRLDNSAELCELLNLDSVDTPDSLIALTAFLRWGEGCFRRFVGEWALAIWDQRGETLYLARDHAGSRSLYFDENKHRLLWSTCLETFFMEEHSRPIDKDYAARYLSCQPIFDRTPYWGIRAVPPAHNVRVDARGARSLAYWSAITGVTISYKKDVDYEEHFLSLFRKAVERRTQAGDAVMVHLSGGMDSSSIVCMADEIERQRCPEAPAVVETLSYFDPTEPHWNEQPFVSAIEEHRNKRGVHLGLSLSTRTFVAPSAGSGVLLPGTDTSSYAWEQQLDQAVRAKGIRVFVTGHGGDEVLGGVPTPLPELADYLVAAEFRLFFRRALQWCLANRLTMLGVFGGTVKHTGRLYLSSNPEPSRLPPWIGSGACRRGDRTLPRHLLNRTRPSAIENERTWNLLLDSLPHVQPGTIARYEYRYPYLDRDLIEFLFSLPREQLVRPGQRRSLMRRALKGIVPEVVLERKRKAFCARGPMIALANAARRWRERSTRLPSVALGLVNQQALEVALDEVVAGNGIEQIGALMRLFHFDAWMDRQREMGYLSRASGLSTDYCLAQGQ